MNTSLWQTPWFVWALILGLGFPLLIIALGEVIHRLRRRGRALAGPLQTVRTVLLPLAVLLLLLTQVLERDPGTISVRVVTTLVWISAIWATLSFMNAVVFGEAEAGTWRARVPRLLRDLVLLGLILFGAAIVLSLVWDVRLAGLVTALGLGSIVIGLALQDTLGSIMSGIALLSERPFSEGDWIQVDTIEGRVLEMNWRAVRLLTRSGDVVVVPHLIIAKQVLQNYSQPTGTHADTVTVGFSYDHPPNAVKNVLLSTARATKGILDDPAPQVRTVEYGDSSVNYEVRYWMENVDERFNVRERFMTRIWYAAQRNRLNIPFPIRTLYHLDGPAAGDAEEALDQSMAAMPFFDGPSGDGDGLSALTDETAFQHFGAGERVIREGTPNDRLFVILAGEARITCTGPGGEDQVVETLARGGLFGVSTVFSGKPSAFSVTAASDLEVVTLRADAAGRMLEGKRSLAREIGRLSEGRREAVAAIKRPKARTGAS